MLLADVVVEGEVVAMVANSEFHSGLYGKLRICRCVHCLSKSAHCVECFVIGNATVLDFMRQSSLNTQEPMTLLCCQLLSL